MDGTSTPQDDREAMAELASKANRTLQPLHGFIYFAPEAAAAYEAIGAAAPGSYFLSRAAPMGAVPAEMIVATFYNFAPWVVHAACEGDTPAPEAMVEARLQAADETMRRILGDDVLGSAEMAEAADLAQTATEVLRPDGRPLYAAYAAMAWPEPAHMRLYHAQTLLREHRGDAHIACLVAEDLNGIEALVTHAATGIIGRGVLQSTRAWSDEQWDAAVAGLQARGVLKADGVFTDAGRAQRERIEATTNELASSPWAHLGVGETQRLRDLARPWSKALMDTISLGRGAKRAN